METAYLVFKWFEVFFVPFFLTCITRTFTQTILSLISCARECPWFKPLWHFCSLVISRQEESGFPVDPVLEGPKTTSSLHTYLLRKENTLNGRFLIDFSLWLQMNGKMCKYPSIKLYLPQMNAKTSKYRIQSMDKIKLNVGWEHSKTYSFTGIS